LKNVTCATFRKEANAFSEKSFGEIKLDLKPFGKEKFGKTKRGAIRFGEVTFDSDMLQTTIDAVRAILSADPSVNSEERKALVEALKKGVKAEAKHDRVLRRPEAARRLGVGVKALDLWKRRGVLVPVTIPGSSRALGFRESDVEALIAGEGGGVNA